MLTDDGEAFVVDFGFHDAGPGVVRDAVTGVALVGTGHPISGDGREHDPRVDLAQLLEAEPTSRQTTGTHRLDDDVADRNEIEEGLLATVGFQVEYDAAFCPVDVQMQQRNTFDDGPRHLPAVVTRWRLDLDDVGTEISERTRDRGGTEHRAFDDAQSR